MVTGLVIYKDLAKELQSRWQTPFAFNLAASIRLPTITFMYFLYKNVRLTYNENKYKFYIIKYDNIV